MCHPCGLHTGRDRRYGVLTIIMMKTLGDVINPKHPKYQKTCSPSSCRDTDFPRIREPLKGE